MEAAYQKLKETALLVLEEKIEAGAKTFKVESRRGDKSFRLTSQDMSIDIGGYLLSNVGDKIKVDINKPEAKVNTVIGNNVFIYSKYKVPIDLLEMGSKYSKIENKTYIIEFNIDKMIKEYNAKLEDGKIYEIS